ncbi:hypothetical protein SAMN05216570_1434 [Dyella sp. OK004]|uniref:hypothetical protein n=1 Tax=Dyella sp. OK004 TaxID=1855292 RepID=UPI0008F1A12B|nr:hypothetical protein [Dyella sp. OK004]SFS00486.1 hypothetical protein SAMN05216570_1434 [Dyella sp. OK004]
MKRIFRGFSVAATMLMGMAGMSMPIHAQASVEGPANPPVFACVDSEALILPTSVHWQAALPCAPPIGYFKSQPGQPSQTVFTAAFNADGTLSGSSALSGNAGYDNINDIYNVTFNSAFTVTPKCTATLIGGGSSDYQIEISSVTTSGAIIDIQYSYFPYAAAASPFVLSCSNPQ